MLGPFAPAAEVTLAQGSIRVSVQDLAPVTSGQTRRQSTLW
jgi:hypothetical protein